MLLKKVAVMTVAVLCMLSSQISRADDEKVVVKMLAIERNTPEERDYWANIEKNFETLHPNVDVQIRYLDDESFKTKRTTLLQSKQRPHIFYSWGGADFHQQAEADLLKDITKEMNGDWENDMSKAGVDAFTYDGFVFGAPLYAANVVLWYNKELLAEAGVDPTQITTWSDFLTAVQKCKDAGVTPVVAGGKDKWPLQFYYGYLALRIAGKEGFRQANEGEEGGFTNEKFLRAAEELKKFADMKPFQSGYMDTTYDKATGLFGDGKGAFHLMGNWDYGAQQAASTTGKGLADSNLGFIPFPAVKDGLGNINDTYGGIDGWLVTKGSPQEAVTWLRFMLSPENQALGGKHGYWIPMAKGSDKDIENPFLRQISQDLAASTYHQLFLDQDLGSSVGNTVNDIAADIAQGIIDPETAVERVQEAWEMQ